MAGYEPNWWYDIFSGTASDGTVGIVIPSTTPQPDWNKIVQDVHRLEQKIDRMQYHHCGCHDCHPYVNPLMTLLD